MSLAAVALATLLFICLGFLFFLPVVVEMGTKACDKRRVLNYRRRLQETLAAGQDDNDALDGNDPIYRFFLGHATDHVLTTIIAEDPNPASVQIAREVFEQRHGRCHGKDCDGSAADVAYHINPWRDINNNTAYKAHLMEARRARRYFDKHPRGISALPFAIRHRFVQYTELILPPL